MCNASNHVAGCPCGWGPPYPASELAADTADISRLPKWKDNELSAFDTACRKAEDTIGVMKARIAQAKKEGRCLDEKDMNWLNEHTIATPTGIRKQYYSKNSPCIKAVIDDYESIFNSSHYRDVLTLLGESCRLKGAGHMNKVLYNVEIGRVTELRDKLLFYKARGM